eukprot:UN00433
MHRYKILCSFFIILQNFSSAVVLFSTSITVFFFILCKTFSFSS